MCYLKEDKEGMLMIFNGRLPFLRHCLTPDTLQVIRLKKNESLSFGVRSEDDVIKIIIDELRRM